MGNFAYKCAQVALSANTFTYYIKPNSNQVTAYYFITGEFKTFSVFENSVPFIFGEVESIALAKNKILIVGGVEADGKTIFEENSQES